MTRYAPGDRMADSRVIRGVVKHRLSSPLLRAVLAFAVLAPVVGCGTMLSDEEFATAGAEGGVVVTGEGGEVVGPGEEVTATTTATGDTTAADGPGATLPGGAPAPAAPGAAPGQSGPNQASDVGVTANEIKVGNIVAVQGTLGPDAFTPMYRGVKTFFQYLNERGGVNGRKVTFLTCDDKENPAIDKRCAQDLIEGQKVFALVGNATDTYAAASYVNAQKVPDVGSYPIGNAYTKYPYLYSIIGSQGYPRNGEYVGDRGKVYAQTATFRYFKNNLGVSKAAVFFYSIAISQTAGKFIADGLQRENIQVVYTPNGGAGRNPADPSYDSDVVQMRNLGVDGIWNAIDVAGFQKLCQAMDRVGFQVKANVSTVQGWSQKVGRDFSAPCRNKVYANAVSVPYSETSNPQMDELIKAVKRYDPNGYLHQWVVDGFIAGRLFTDGVGSMGPAPTREGLVKWLDAQRDYRAGGLLAPGVDWRRGGVDWTQPEEECFSLGRWDDAEQTFVAAAPTFTCEVSAFYSYVPVDDGS